MSQAKEFIGPLRQVVQRWREASNDRFFVQEPFMNGDRTFDDLADAWYTQISRIVCWGNEGAPRGLATLELCAESFRVRNLRANIIVHPTRDLNYKFMVAEWLWILSGSDFLELIAQFNSQLRQFSDDSIHLAGAYGPRLAHQWPYIAGKLLKPESRQAVATIWTPSPPDSKDIPCTISLQWLLRDGKLNVIVTMRSSDVILGLPYDGYVFSQLTNWLAAVIGVETGWMHFQLGSSHLYSDKLNLALTLLERDEALDWVSSPQLTNAIVPFEAERLLRNRDCPPGEYKVFANILSKPRSEALSLLKSAWCK